MEREESKKTDKNRLFLWGLLLSFFAVALLFSIPAIAIWEWNVADIWARLQYPRTVAEKVAVVGIDDDLFVVQGYDWPLEKDIYGELIYYLQEMGARVITFDLEFSHDFNSCGASDSLFLGMVATSPEVVMGYGFMVQPSGGGVVIPERDNELLHFPKQREREHHRQIDERFSIGRGRIPLEGYDVVGAMTPYPKLNDHMLSCGFFNRSKQMTDGIDRWMPLMIEQDSLIFSSLALSSVQQYLEDSVYHDAGASAVKLGEFSWPVTSSANVLVNFTDSVPVYTMSDVMISFQNYLLGGTPEIGKDELEDRIVFIGYTAGSDGDLGKNPVSKMRDAGNNYGGQTPMVMLHAYTANTLLENRVISYYGRTGALLLSLLVTLLIYSLFRKVPQNVLYPLLPFLFVGIGSVGFMLYREYQFLPVVESLVSGGVFALGGIFVNYYVNSGEYRYLNSVFRTYISPELIDEMVKSHVVPKLGGESIEGTAFFTDIEKFSTFSEQFTPEELISVLNEYFSEMTTILQNYKGTLDKFIGDAIVAIFGAPYYFEENALFACNAAWEMQVALNKLREKWSKNSLLVDKVSSMKMRIGINSGPFIVGNMGSIQRMNYTMIGDTVNLAARLESAAKQYGIYVLVGEDTYHYAKKDFLFRCIDRIVVVGRTEPVSIYELMSPCKPTNQKVHTLISQYERALDIYSRGDFIAAIPEFEKSLLLESNGSTKSPSSVMIERCKMLIKTPPITWNGVFSLQSK